jgi:hypothetical protein
VTRTMQLCGVSRISEIGPELLASQRTPQADTHAEQPLHQQIEH